MGVLVSHVGEEKFKFRVLGLLRHSVSPRSVHSLPDPCERAMDSTPMISGRYLKQFLGQRVCLLGQVVQEVSPNAFQVRLSDNVDVTVHTPHGTEITT